MAETVEEQTTPKPKVGPIVKRLRSFAKAHDGATAVVEYIGQKGARIVLVGGDGRWGDQVVAGGVEAATTACAEAEIPVKDEWERDLVTGIKTDSYEWNYMGGSAARGGGTR
ncbi:hypothetical protein [Cryptosporangium minutisporangium]